MYIKITKHKKKIGIANDLTGSHFASNINSCYHFL
jgi:hypothetical protein